MNWWKFSRQCKQMHKYISLIRNFGINNVYLCKLGHVQVMSQFTNPTLFFGLFLFTFEMYSFEITQDNPYKVS